MKYLIVLLLTGCATPPQFIANYYNDADLCQKAQRPSFCGAGNNVIGVVRTTTGKPVNIITSK
jgi:hypothetical protein